MFLHKSATPPKIRITNKTASIFDYDTLCTFPTILLSVVPRGEKDRAMYKGSAVGTQIPRARSPAMTGVLPSLAAGEGGGRGLIEVQRAYSTTCSGRGYTVASYCQLLLLLIYHNLIPAWRTWSEL